MGPHRILLASASPRRRVLLQRAGIEFEVEASDLEEHLSHGNSVQTVAEHLAQCKARAVAARHSKERLLVVGADTIVAVGSGVGTCLLGKPRDEDEAAEMLGSLSGSRHRVVTGVAVVRTWDGAERVAHECTWVTMREITQEERAAYVASGEWRDKAGGYAIQENADAFVSALEGGGFDNVVGLPVGLTLELLRSSGLDSGPR